MNADASPRHLWGMPVLLATIAAFGLLSALLGDGAWDVASWLAMGAVAAVALRYAFAR